MGAELFVPYACQLLLQGLGVEGPQQQKYATGDGQYAQLRGKCGEGCVAVEHLGGYPQIPGKRGECYG